MCIACTQGVHSMLENQLEQSNVSHARNGTLRQEEDSKVVEEHTNCLHQQGYS